MALDDIEIAPEYQAIAAEAYRDGRFRHAHNLRALSRSVNQLAMEGEPLLTLSWDSRNNTDIEQTDEKAPRAVCSPTWTRMLPGIHKCTKMPGLTKADFFIQAEITEDAQVFLQIETLNAVLDVTSNSPSGRVFELIGTGALEEYELNDIPISPGLYERIGFWCRGKRTAIEGDTDAHGDPAKGTVNRVEIEGTTAIIWSQETANWHLPGVDDDTWAIDHVVIVHDGDVSTIGSVLYEGQIIDVIQNDSNAIRQQGLKVFRAPSPSQALGFRKSSLSEVYYAIYELPKIRIVAIDAYTQDRTS